MIVTPIAYTNFDAESVPASIDGTEFYWHLRDIAPASVQDMPLEPFGTEVAA